MTLQEVVQTLQGAIEASVFVAPNDFDLSREELGEVGNRLGMGEGEIEDALRELNRFAYRRSGRITLPENIWGIVGNLSHAANPDLRRPEAYDFVFASLNERVIDIGSVKACMDRTVMLSRAPESIRKHVDVAITLMLLSGQLQENDGVLRFRPGQNGVRQLPSTYLSGGHGHFANNKAARDRTMPHVTDVIARRSEGRTINIESLDAFSQHLVKLGYGHFRVWWSQTVAELKRTEPSSSSLSALILAAALVEAALIFVVKHARTSGLAVFASNDFDDDPKKWKINALVESAARGGESAILDSQTKNRVVGLIDKRQRIHVGRMLSEYTGSLPIPETKPEEAREAKSVAEHVVRRILEWLERHSREDFSN